MIRTVGIVGLGNLGILFGKQMTDRSPMGAVRFIANRKRIERYERDGIFCNGEKLALAYSDCDTNEETVDLLIYAVKYSSLPQAIADSASYVGENTTILSLLNGVVSESDIGRAYGVDKLLYTVAQGMDGVMIGNQLTYHSQGMLCIGEYDGIFSQKLRDVVAYFEATGVPHEVRSDMAHHLYSKMMLNAGVNQVVAANRGTYAIVQKPGAQRDRMGQAMEEVARVAAFEGITLTKEDMAYWFDIIDKLNPDGKPSMAQDIDNKKPTEVALFAGTVCRLGRKYGMPTPVNDQLLKEIQTLESNY